MVMEKSNAELTLNLREVSSKRLNHCDFVVASDMARACSVGAIDRRALLGSTATNSYFLSAHDPALSARRSSRTCVPASGAPLLPDAVRPRYPLLITATLAYLMKLWLLPWRRGCLWPEQGEQVAKPGCS